MNTKIKAVAATVAVVGAFATQPAVADTLRIDEFANGSIVANISNTPASPIGPQVSAGGLLMSNLSVTPNSSFQAWCVDIFGSLASSAPYTLVSGASFYPSNPGKVTDLEALATRYLPSVNGNAASSGAFQLAVWEIVNESSGVYSLGSGSFTATSTTTAAISTANAWLSNLNAATTNTAQILSVWKETPGYPTQDLAVFAPVPEPETYAMMLAGLGLIGFIVRRRTQPLDGTTA